MGKEKFFKRLSVVLSILLVVLCGYIIELSYGAPIELQPKETAVPQKVESVRGTDNGKKENIEKININTADIKELCELKGIGETIAGRIVKYREEYGKFISVEDLLGVNGIGEKKLEKIRDFICVE